MVEKAKEEKRRKILVIGCGGMLGVDLCKELSRDYNVIGLDIRASNAFIHCDITDKNKTIKAITGAKPDLIIHTAAWTDVDGCEREPAKAEKINVDGTENIVNACSDLGIPLVYISTDFVFDGDKKSPYTEKGQPNPTCVYGKSKLEGEKRVRSLNKYIILRTSWLYGANGKNFVDTILEKAKSCKALRVVDDQIGTPTYTKDFSKAVVRLIDLVLGTRKPKWEIYHVSNKGEVSWFDYAKEILRIAGIDDVKVLPIKSDKLNRPAKRPAYTVLDNAKFEEIFDFTMRRWEGALREYLK